MTVGFSSVLQKPFRDCFVVVMETVLRRETSEEMQYFLIDFKLRCSSAAGSCTSRVRDRQSTRRQVGAGGGLLREGLDESMPR